MNDVKNLRFIFNENDFQLDKIEGNEKSEWYQKFDANRYDALYQWGFQEQPTHIHTSSLFLYQISEAFINALTTHSELEIVRENCIIACNDNIWQAIQNKIPFVVGSEYITYEYLCNIFNKLNEIFKLETSIFDGSMKQYLAEKNQNLRMPERIFFHLVENKDDEFPFAFMATYATKDDEGNVKHLPLKYALSEYKHDRDKLLSLLSCLNKAAQVSELIELFMQNGELFHPLKLTSEEAYQFLQQVEKIEHCGILCRIPNWWRRKYSSISMQVSMGEKKPSLLGFDSLLSLQPKLVVNGVELTKSDVKQLLTQSEGLANLKGKWVEVNHEKLKALLIKFADHKGEIKLLDAIRQSYNEDKDLDSGILMSNGQWLSKLLHDLRSPSSLEAPKMPNKMKVTLRPYQKIGFTWLDYMNTLGFGACLADDMGLGKTVQVLTFLEHIRNKNVSANVLLVVPASLLGNWEKEANKFAPKMNVHILHGRGSVQLKKELNEGLSFLTITTYGMVSKLNEIANINWDCLILDEAQAIKNPLTTQTKAVKQINSKMRIAMTGTPIENELANLWSLFDFLNKGLLGTSAEFKAFVKRLDEHPEGYEKLKLMVSPFILRRIKTDKSIISDLPDKLESVSYVALSKKQIVLYRKLLDDMEQKIMNSTGIERRGLVLSAITKLKQICNHPDQYLGEDTYSIKESGKFIMLKELCETIFEKRERVIVFTQYKEIIPFISRFLTEIFHKEGLIIHGGTPIKKRGDIVDTFNGEEYIPYVVCSLKAAGVGLNLTSANHVIHFDRWWNPAVENQATDRAFRIGQKKNVVVHKLVSEGTIEEKIDQIINSKKELAEQIIGSTKETWITELNNDELMSILRLDLR